MRQTLNLTAGQALRVLIPGRVLQFISIVGASSISLQAEYGSQENQEEFGLVTSIFKLGPDTMFSAFTLLSAVNCTVDVLISMRDLTVNQFQGQTVTATIDPSQVPLQVREDVASSIVDNAAVAVDQAGEALLAVSALRKAARFTNLGPDPVALGTTGVTWAKRCLVLNAGDTHFEEKGANLVWIGITGAAKSASVTVQEVLA